MADGQGQDDSKRRGSGRRLPNWLTTDWRALTSRLKQNVLVGLCLLLGTGVIAMSSFTEAVTNLTHLFRGVAAPAISGTWYSGSLVNIYDKNQHSHMSFDFRVEGKNLSGTVSEVEEQEPHKDENSELPVIDGSIDGQAVSFHTNFHIPDDEKEYHEFYQGQIEHGILQLRNWNDLPSGGDIQKIAVARLKPAIPQPARLETDGRQTPR